MSIQHHPSDDSLMAYAGGSLPEAFNLIMATHVSLCDTCRARVDGFDAMGGALVEITDGAKMATGALDHTLDLLMDTPADAALPTAPSRGVFPAPLQDYIGGDLDAVRWRPIGKGMRQAILPTSRDATARLLSISAGVAMPDHGHAGSEMTLVLQGAFHDGDATFARGDMETADQDVTHTPVADTSGDCICLFVTDAPLQFGGWVPRILQRFARI